MRLIKGTLFDEKKFNKRYYMKKETGVLIAGAVSFLAVVGFLALRKFLNGYDSDCYYSDYHKILPKKVKDEEHHGVEYLSML